MFVKESGTFCVIVIEPDDINEIISKTRFERCDLLCIPIEYIVNPEFNVKELLSCISILGHFFGEIYFYNNYSSIQDKLRSFGINFE